VEAAEAEPLAQQEQEPLAEVAGEALAVNLLLYFQHGCCLMFCMFRLAWEAWEALLARQVMRLVRHILLFIKTLLQIMFLLTLKVALVEMLPQLEGRGELLLPLLRFQVRLLEY
jgi:hypothetical protein